MFALNKLLNNFVVRAFLVKQGLTALVPLVVNVTRAFKFFALSLTIGVPIFIAVAKGLQVLEERQRRAGEEAEAFNLIFSKTPEQIRNSFRSVESQTRTIDVFLTGTTRRLRELNIELDNLRNTTGVPTDSPDLFFVRVLQQILISFNLLEKERNAEIDLRAIKLKEERADLIEARSSARASLVEIAQLEQARREQGELRLQDERDKQNQILLGATAANELILINDIQNTRTRLLFTKQSANEVLALTTRLTTSLINLDSLRSKEIIQNRQDELVTLRAVTEAAVLGERAVSREISARDRNFILSAKTEELAATRLARIEETRARRFFSTQRLQEQLITQEREAGVEQLARAAFLQQDALKATIDGNASLVVGLKTSIDLLNTNEKDLTVTREKTRSKEAIVLIDKALLDIDTEKANIQRQINDLLSLEGAQRDAISASELKFQNQIATLNAKTTSLRLDALAQERDTIFSKGIEETTQGQRRLSQIAREEKSLTTQANLQVTQQRQIAGRVSIIDRLEASRARTQSSSLGDTEKGAAIVARQTREIERQTGLLERQRGGLISPTDQPILEAIRQEIEATPLEIRIINELKEEQLRAIVESVVIRQAEINREIQAQRDIIRRQAEFISGPPETG